MLDSFLTLEETRRFREFRNKYPTIYGKPMLNIIELNTVDNPQPRYMDETERVFCSKCKNRLRVGDNQIERLITDTHLEICEGDSAITLMRIEQIYKECFSR